MQYDSSMATLAYDLMKLFYEENRAALARDAFEEAAVWSSCESAVNDIHHGVPNSEWVARLIERFDRIASDEETVELQAIWREAASLLRTL